ncbi:MAG: hypothetical protein ACRDV6_09440 [Acidimicrobiales bacterium]
MSPDFLSFSGFSIRDWTSGWNVVGGGFPPVPSSRPALGRQH